MEFIKLDLVEYNYKYKAIASGEEVYINKECIAYVRTEAKKLSETRRVFSFDVYTKSGRSFSISKECYDRILRVLKRKHPNLPDTKRTETNPKEEKLN